MNEFPEEILNKMFDNDAFSQWMQMEKISIGPGTCTLRMKVRKEMLNGFGIAHGAITYSLADSALAFASNSHNRKAVSVETSISHTAGVYENDVLTAFATEQSLSNKIGIYHIQINNQKNETVALFKGTVYRTSKPWIEK
jgi:acyl-CoA thioesterase